jgi:hypothetical protein
VAARGAGAILSQGTAMISTAISMNSAEIGKRHLHIPDLVDQTELDRLKPLRGVPETAD